MASQLAIVPPSPPIALADARDVLLRYLDALPAVRPFERLCIAVGMTASELRRGCRQPELVNVRFAMMLVMSDMGYDDSMIGRLFHRDHSTVSHGVACARQRIATDAKFRDAVAALSTIVNSPVSEVPVHG